MVDVEPLVLAHLPGLWCSNSALKNLQGKAGLPEVFPQSLLILHLVDGITLS